MTELPEKFPLTSADIAAEKREQLRRCLAAAFPEIMAEDKIDLDQLRRVLGEWVEPDRERFGLTWPGKAACMKVIQAPSVGTLKPCREESVDWDTTENVFIEGDNLEVLKLLQKAYFGKVKMIYIDPPYNTGGEFIYPDKYSETLDTYLEYTGQKDSEGRSFSTLRDESGRFHSRWLNMMYPRLYLAKNLLRDDGFIFVSIDDGEVDNLKKVMSEIFGEENFIGNAVWEKAYTANMTAQFISATHDNILIYARNAQAASLGRVARTDEQKAAFKNFDNDSRGPWKAENLSAGKFYSAGQFEIIGPTGEKFLPPPGRYWRCNETQYKAWLADGRITFGRDGTGRPMLKKFLSEAQEGLTPRTWWPHEEFGTNKEANLELKEIFGGEALASTPKPVKLLMQICQLSTDPDCIILDFFAGSGTSAHAAMNLNINDGGRRKYIVIQLPEPTDRQDYQTVSAVCRERIRRVSAQIRKELAQKLDLKGVGDVDIGFRVFKLDRSNFRSWDGTQTDDAQLAAQLELHIDHVAGTSSAEDILYELLLKDGFPLATPIEKLSLAGKEVFSIASGALLICLDRRLTQDVIDAMADLEPQRVICLDAGFQGNDQLKANAVQTFKARARNRETAIEFRTV